jgi:hypothetical protein
MTCLANAETGVIINIVIIASNKILFIFLLPFFTLTLLSNLQVNFSYQGVEKGTGKRLTVRLFPDIPFGSDPKFQTTLSEQ